MTGKTWPPPGHCGHPPQCIGVDPPDERDPLGCCHCGTREAEKKYRAQAQQPAQGAKEQTMQEMKQVSPTGEPYLPPRLVRPLMAVYVALTGLVGYLTLFEDDPLARKVGLGAGLVLATLGPLLGLASPGLRRAGKVVIVLLSVSLTVPVYASELTLFGSETQAMHAVMDGHQLPVLKYLEVGTAIGVELRAWKATPAVLALGGVGLADVLGVQLALVAGGGAVLGASEVGVPFLLGLSAGWKRGPIKLGLVAAGAYHAPPDAGWALVTGVSFTG